MTVKNCFGDGETQPAHVAPISAFGGDVRRADGLNVYCKTCAATRQRKWKRDNKVKVMQYKREYRKRLKEQDGALA